jgi:4'-phosphopantetheinyl transferase
LRRPRISFNLTHTRGLVACAVTRSGEVGIDVEAIDDAVDVLDLARHCFSREEVFALKCRAEADRPERFVDEMTFMFRQPSTILFASPDRMESARWRFALFAPSARHRLAVAVRSMHAANVAALLMRLPETGSEARELLPFRSS